MYVLSESHNRGSKMIGYKRIRPLLSREILETAYLLFNKKGYDRTKIEDICKKLNINERQFYYHYKSLDEVLEILWAA